MTNAAVGRSTGTNHCIALQTVQSRTSELAKPKHRKLIVAGLALIIVLRRCRRLFLLQRKNNSVYSINRGDAIRQRRVATQITIICRTGSPRRSLAVSRNYRTLTSRHAHPYFGIRARTRTTDDWQRVERPGNPQRARQPAWRHVNVELWN